MADGDNTKRAGRESLVFLALGGLGEIGMNCYLYGQGSEDSRTWLMVDLGITFPEGEFDPGVDIILPDLKFIEDRAEDLAGLVLTHAHEDHFGAVIELWPKLKVPIYATPFTAALLRAKLAEMGGKNELPIREIAMGARFKVGAFDLEFVTMAHSIPEPNGLIIRTGHGTVFHTGDWKLEERPVLGPRADEAKIEALGRDPVLALVCDSTNAFRDGRSPSESQVAASLTDIIKGSKRAVAVTTFASNVGRIKAVADAARTVGRDLVVAGRAMHRIIQVAKETGYLPPNFRYFDQQEFSDISPDRVLVLLTGSQGEPRAALARIAENEHPSISLGKGDLVVFSSRTIPGNEKSVGRIQNALARMGCDVVTDDKALVHVTGHPRREELKQMYGWVKPQIAIPMHGEMRHLKEHAELARAAGVPRVLTPINGEIVELAPGPAAIIDEAPVGRLFRDGRLLVSALEGPVRNRRKLSFVGIVMVSLVLSRRGDLVSDPIVSLDGVPEETGRGRAMEDIVLDAVEGTIDSIPPQRRRDPEVVREAVRRAVRSAVDDHWGKKPIAKVHVSVVDVRS
jgi:ribonuclease J